MLKALLIPISDLNWAGQYLCLVAMILDHLPRQRKTLRAGVRYFGHR